MLCHTLSSTSFRCVSTIEQNNTCSLTNLANTRIYRVHFSISVPIFFGHRNNRIFQGGFRLEIIYLLRQSTPSTRVALEMKISYREVGIFAIHSLAVWPKIKWNSNSILRFSWLPTKNSQQNFNSKNTIFTRFSMYLLKFPKKNQKKLLNPPIPLNLFVLLRSADSNLPPFIPYFVLYETPMRWKRSVLKECPDIKND